MTPRFLPSLAPILPHYDVFLVDLWGVVHDGEQLYPGALATLSLLHAQGKHVIFLSNAPRRAARAAAMLTALGIAPPLYHSVMTSGETAYHDFAREDAAQRYGKTYFYLGSARDHALLAGLPYHHAEMMKDADFILLTHAFYDNQPFEELEPLLEHALARRLPVICVNPDQETLSLQGERVYCAGRIARHYAAMGGEVRYFGKPYPAIYEAGLASQPEHAASRVLAVGDTLATDIQGGNAQGLNTALVTGGVLRATTGPASGVLYEAACLAACAAERIMPRYILPAFIAA